MNQSRSRRSKGHQIPLFIQKLVDILDNQEIEQIVSWTSTKDSFQIRSISKFTEEVLPNYFKHCNFSSFIRQLNMYGFRKIRHTDGDNVYLHECFKAGAKSQLRNITRKIKEDQQHEDTLAIYQPDNSQFGRQLKEIRTKQSNLEDLCKNLLYQNKKLMEDNANIMQRYKADTEEREKNLQQFLLTFVLSQKARNELTGQDKLNQRLTLREGQNEGSSLESLLGNSEEQAESIKKLRNMMQNAYFGKSKKGVRKSNNFTIVPPKPEEGAVLTADLKCPAVEDLDSPNQENSFFSVNDFLNAEEYSSHINLDESR